MNTNPDHTLAADIEAAILATPGVTAVFRTGSTTAKIIASGATVLGLRETNNPLVRIESTTEQISVEVSIGVTGAVSVIDTVKRLHSLISAMSTQITGQPTETRITVAHIDETPVGQRNRVASPIIANRTAEQEKTPQA